jgi:hypothetical protein
MVTLTINGKKVKAKENTPLLEIARKMSILIPTLHGRDFKKWKVSHGYSL